MTGDMLRHGPQESISPLVFFLPGKSAVEEFQKLVDKTYRKAYTKDRAKHNPTNPKAVGRSD